MTLPFQYSVSETNPRDVEKEGVISRELANEILVAVMDEWGVDQEERGDVFSTILLDAYLNTTSDKRILGMLSFGDKKFDLAAIRRHVGDVPGAYRRFMSAYADDAYDLLKTGRAKRAVKRAIHKRAQALQCDEEDAALAYDYSKYCSKMDEAEIRVAAYYREINLEIVPVTTARPSIRNAYSLGRVPRGQRTPMETSPDF
jgi:hypothetical protein